MPIGQADQHQANVAMNRGAVENLDRKTISDYANATDTGKLTQRAAINREARMSDANSDNQIISRAMSSLSNMGAMDTFLDPVKIKNRRDRDESNVKGKEENADKSELSKEILRSSRGTLINQAFKKNNNPMKFAESLDSEGRQMLEDYESLFSKSVISQNDPNQRSQIKRRMEQLESRLMEKGMNAEQFREVGSQIRGAATQELASLMKEAFLKKLTAPTKSIEWAISEKNLNSVLNFAMTNTRMMASLGGGLKELMDRAKQDAMDQISSTILNEFEKDLIREGVRSNQPMANKDVKSFIEMAMQAGVDVAKWSKEWENKKWDLGLQELPDNVKDKIAEEKKNLTDFGQDDQNQKQNQKKDDGPDISADDKETLFDQFREVVATRLIDDSIKTRFDTAFTMRNINRKMKQLGIDPKDMQRIREEAKGLARLKLISLLKTAYLERVVLLAESGARVKVSSRRISKLREKLTKLGAEITEDELSKIRHEAEFMVHSSAVAKLAAIKVTESVDGHNADIEQERTYLTKLMTGIERRWQYDNMVSKSEIRKGNMMKRIFGRIGAFRRIDGQV